MVSYDQIAVQLTQSISDYHAIARTAYDMFYNTTPMDITISVYDTNNNLQSYVVPNRAKDKAYLLNGNGSPENSVIGNIGSLYQDRTNGELYIKAIGNGNTGWSKIINKTVLDSYLIKGNGTPEGAVTAGKGALYVDVTNSNLYAKTTAVGNTGWVSFIKGNLSTDGTLSANSDSIISSQKAIKTYVDSKATRDGMKAYTVASGSQDVNGYANFLSKVSNSSVKISATTTPLIYVYPNGVVETLTSDYTISNINTNGTYTIIKEYEGSFFATLSSITESITPPTSASNGDYWLNIGVRPYKPYKRVSNAWVTTQFIKLGELTISGGTMGVPISYAFNGRYDSGLFSVTKDTLYTKQHNLGIQSSNKYHFSVADNNIGLNERDNNSYFRDTQLYGFVKNVTTKNSLSLKTAVNYVASAIGPGGMVNGYYRIQVERGW